MQPAYSTKDQVPFEETFVDEITQGCGGGKQNLRDIIYKLSYRISHIDRVRLEIFLVKTLSK